MVAWRELNKIDPNKKKQHPRPVDFKDYKGNLLTNHENIKMHCLSSIIKRLRKRPMHPQLMKVEKRKIKLSKGKKKEDSALDNKTDGNSNQIHEE